MLSSLVCLGRHTITGLLHTAGGSFQDWSALYRVFSQSRLDSDALSAASWPNCGRTSRWWWRSMIHCCPSAAPKPPASPGVAIRWVPGFRPTSSAPSGCLRSPPPGPPARDPARLIPIDFQHAPTPPKPRKNASCEERRQYREASRKASLARRGAARLHALRQNLDQEHDVARRLEVLVDGRFTHRVVLKNLPPRTVLIGRLGQDAKLYRLPPPLLWPAGADARRVAARRRRPLAARQAYGPAGFPDAHQDLGAPALASGRRPHQLALGGDRAARLSAPQGLAAVVSPPGLSDRHRHRAVPATDRPA